MKKNTFGLLLSLLFFFALFFFSYMYRKKRDKDIESHSKFTIGKITKFTTSLKSGDAWYYSFNYKNSLFESYRSTHVDYDVSIGDYFLVNFSSENPNNSKILYQYKLKEDKLNYVDSVWDSIPTSILRSGLKH